MTTLLWDTETTGLDFFLDKIICISIIDESGNTQTFIGDNEEDNIRRFFSYLVNYNDLTLGGFNNESYDTPILITKCLKYGIMVPKFKSFDLRKVAGSFFVHYNNKMIGKLGDYAHLIGLPVETSRGCEMPRLYAEKKWGEIKAHCEEDITVTLALYKRCKECGLL